MFSLSSMSMTAIGISICSFIVSFCSLLIAGFLAYLRIREYRRDNRVIHVTCHMSGEPGSGDRIFLTNLSATPVLVDYWQVGWLTRGWFRNKFQPINLFADEDLHLTLKPRERKTLNFVDQYTFNWHPKNKGEVELFIELHIAGKQKALQTICI